MAATAAAAAAAKHNVNLKDLHVTAELAQRWKTAVPHPTGNSNRSHNNFTYNTPLYNMLKNLSCLQMHAQNILLHGQETTMRHNNRKPYNKAALTHSLQHPPALPAYPAAAAAAAQSCQQHLLAPLLLLLLLLSCPRLRTLAHTYRTQTDARHPAALLVPQLLLLLLLLLPHATAWQAAAVSCCLSCPASHTAAASHESCTLAAHAAAAAGLAAVGQLCECVCWVVCVACALLLLLPVGQLRSLLLHLLGAPASTDAAFQHTQAAEPAAAAAAAAAAELDWAPQHLL
jgi:hypothetical protein